MYHKLTELISNGDYNGALYEFQEEFFHIEERTPAEASQLCVLEATLWEALFDSYAEYDAISRGLSYNPENYELFYMLGLYFTDINVNQAYLCMEMALFYCSDAEDCKIIRQQADGLLSALGMRVRNTSIAIVSYNNLELIKECIDSIEKYQPHDSIEVVVVDNASTQDGVVTYLRKKRDQADYPFKLIENKENLGFSKGCNIAANACDPDNDIFFLNNDAILTPNSLFFLRMGLYENRKVGATGALSNSASLQEIPAREIFEGAGREDLIEKYDKDEGCVWHKEIGMRDAYEVFRTFAEKRNVPTRNPYIKRFRLTGFAVLMSRAAIDTVYFEGQIFDEYFSPAYFEDDDLGIRIARSGFEQLLCTNSLIYHNGGSGFFGNDELMEIGREKFKNKWGFDIWGVSSPMMDVVEKVVNIAKEKGHRLSIIDFTCDFGATVSYIKHNLPDAFVAGVCTTSFGAGIASTIADEVAYGDMNTMRLPWKRHSFDVVIYEKYTISKGRVSECLNSDGVSIEQEGFS